MNVQDFIISKYKWINYNNVIKSAIILIFLFLLFQMCKEDIGIKQKMSEKDEYF